MVRITISGIDGSGKSTLCGRLAEWLRANGKQVQLFDRCPRAFRESPTEVVSPSSNYLSDIVFNLAYLEKGHAGFARELVPAQYLDYIMLLEEVQAYEREIFPSTQRGQLTICDRHVLDRMVHARAAGIPTEIVEQIAALIPEPELALYLDLDVHQALERLSRRATGRGPDETLEVLETNRQLYEQHLIQSEGIVRIDATISSDSVFAAAVRAVEQHIMSIA